ncbi:MAG TPA: ATP-binding protein [Kouleothrix sp.]|nr:ATP-binding protein [Kouleothrix sp.]HRC75184.1 ATP-binding protein [Kouleothrix sp.]
MSTSPDTELVHTISTPPMLRASVEQVAGALGESVGAWACYMALSATAGQSPRLLAIIGRKDDLPTWRALDGAALLRRAFHRREAMKVQAGGWPALALPIIHDGQAIGAALLLYDYHVSIDAERAIGAAHLAANAIASAREVALLHLQAEQIEERTRLREIQVSRNLIRGVIDSVPMGLALIGSDGVILAANRALSDLFGFEPAALVGRHYSAAMGSWPDSPAGRTFESKVSERVRRTLLRPDGAQVLQEIASFPLFDANGQPHQVVEVWEDITERVALQTQLVRAEKLAAIGQLAASIAHEVGNPLQAIQGFLSLFLEQCPPDLPNERYLQLAEEEIDRIVQVLARLRDLYRPRADVFGDVDVNELISSVLLLTGKQLERNSIRTMRELHANMPKIHAVADQIKQVFLNLVLNAAEAMSSGGLLHVQTYISDERTHGRYVVATITDTGYGIPPEQLKHIFDGMHTTKERGMGLGLYTSKAIIDRHMGRISVQSQVGEGTTFTIMLPCANEETTV